MYEYVTVTALCIGQYQASVVRIEDGILLARHVDFRFFSLDLRRFVIDLIMHPRQKLRGSCSEPSSAPELERTEMTSPISHTQDCIRILLELLKRDSRLGRDLIAH